MRRFASPNQQRQSFWSLCLCLVLLMLMAYILGGCARLGQGESKFILQVVGPVTGYVENQDQLRLGHYPLGSSSVVEDLPDGEESSSRYSYVKLRSHADQENAQQVNVNDQLSYSISSSGDFTAHFLSLDRQPVIIRLFREHHEPGIFGGRDVLDGRASFLFVPPAGATFRLEFSTGSNLEDLVIQLDRDLDDDYGESIEPVAVSGSDASRSIRLSTQAQTTEAEAGINVRLGVSEVSNTEGGESSEDIDIYYVDFLASDEIERYDGPFTIAGSALVFYWGVHESGPVEEGNTLVVGDAGVFDIEREASVDGTPMTVDIDAPGERAVVSFEISEPQPVSVTLTNTDFFTGSCCSPDVWLQTANGQEIERIVLWNYMDAVLRASDLWQPGTYQLIVDPVLATTGTTTVSVRSAQPLKYEIDVGQPATSVDVMAPGQDTRIEVTGSAGDTVSLRFDQIFSSFSPQCCKFIVDLRSPSGVVLLKEEYVGPSNESFRLQLEETGTYLLEVSRFGLAGSFRIEAARIDDYTSDIVVDGSAVDVTISERDQLAELRFNGSAGDPITIRTSNVDGCCVAEISLIDPGGNLLKRRSDDSRWARLTETAPEDARTIAVVLPDTGVYTIVVDPVAERVGTMAIAVRGHIARPLHFVEVGDEPVDLRFDDPGAVESVSFFGLDPGLYEFEISDVTTNSGDDFPGLLLHVEGPDGTVRGIPTLYKRRSSGEWATMQASKLLGSRGPEFYRMRIGTRGIYSIGLELTHWFEAAPGTATFRFARVIGDVEGELDIGDEARRFSTSEPGQAIRLSFTADAGNWLRAEFTDVGIGFSGALGSTAWFENANGELLAQQHLSDSQSYLSFRPSEAGSYLLVIQPDADTVGGVTVNLREPQSDYSPITRIPFEGVPLHIETTAPGEFVRVEFNGQDGQKVAVVSYDIELDEPTDYWCPFTHAIRRPDESQLFKTQCPSLESGGNTDFIELDATGIHSAEFVFMVGLTGSFTMNILLSDTATPAEMQPAAVYGGPIQIEVAHVGTIAWSSFEGSTGASLLLEFANNEIGAFFSLSCDERQIGSNCSR